MKAIQRSATLTNGHNDKTSAAEAFQSSEATEDMIQCAHAVCPVTDVQNRYFMMARWYGELFPVLEELNIGYVAFSPLANGFLSAKYGRESVFDIVYDYWSMMLQFTSQGIAQNQELLALKVRTGMSAAFTYPYTLSSAALSFSAKIFQKPWKILDIFSRSCSYLLLFWV